MGEGLSLDFDVVVIGGGLLGCFAARGLTRYGLSVALLEAREDLCTGVSRSNTAIVYSGCDTKPGTLKSSMCVRASQGFAELCEELGVRYSPCGSIMICFGKRGYSVLERKYTDGAGNGVRGMRLLTREEVLGLEPNITPSVHSGLYVPDTGTVDPWELCLAAAQNAAHNGAEFFLRTEVTGVRERGEGYEVTTRRGPFRAGAVVNCAGLAADSFLEMVSEPSVRIVPSAGDYLIYDTKASGAIRHIIFHEPEEKGKGLTLVPTVDGNILAGPTERPTGQTGEPIYSDAPDGGGRPESPTGDLNRSLCGGKDETHGAIYDYSTERAGLDLLRSLAAEVIPSLSIDHVIRSFGAVRPNPYLMFPDCNGKWVQSDKSVSDFCIIESGGGRFISLVGVKTPGLTCANELGLHVAEKIATALGAAQSRETPRLEGADCRGATRSGEAGCRGADGFDPCRKAPVRLGGLSFEERESRVLEDPGHGAIVCRCRGVSESEILDSLKRFPGAVTRDGVKRRTGAGSGRCQGSFCGQAVDELLASHLGDEGGKHRGAGKGASKNTDKGADKGASTNADKCAGNSKYNEAGSQAGSRPGDENSAVSIIRPQTQITTHDVIVIGGGPAGMAAALGASSYGAGVLVVERADSLGGILNQCTHKGFGLTYFGEELSGQEYAARFIRRVEASEIEVLTGCIVLDIGADGVLTLSGRETGLLRLHGKAVVLATGCRERPIGALLIPGTRPEGIFAAGAAQKMINLGGYDLGDRFVILGSGDVGMIVARELALRGKSVAAVIEKEDRCGGLQRNRINCLERFGIPLITSATISRIRGLPRIAGVTVAKQEAGSHVSFDIGCDALITSVGLVPERDLLDSFGGGLPDWLFLCGNACFVHDVVDDVTLESGRTGGFAAAYAMGGAQGAQDAQGAQSAQGEQGAQAAQSAQGAQGAKEGDSSVLRGKKEEPPPVSHGVLCTACPKGCLAVRSAGGWSGLLCGRNEPL